MVQYLHLFCRAWHWKGVMHCATTRLKKSLDMFACSHTYHGIPPQNRVCPRTYQMWESLTMCTSSALAFWASKRAQFIAAKTQWPRVTHTHAHRQVLVPGRSPTSQAKLTDDIRIQIPLAKQRSLGLSKCSQLGHRFTCGDNSLVLPLTSGGPMLDQAVCCVCRAEAAAELHLSAARRCNRSSGPRWQVEDSLARCTREARAHLRQGRLGV